MMKICKNQKLQIRHQRQKIHTLLGRPRPSAEERFEREYDVEIKEGDEKGSKQKISGS